MLVKRAKSKFIEGIYARDSNGVLKAEIELLYPRRPLPTAVIAGYSQLWILQIQINLTIFVNTYLDCRKIKSKVYRRNTGGVP